MSNNFYNKDNYVPSQPFSEIIYNLEITKDFLAITPDENFDDNLIVVIMDATASYVEDYTGLSREELDKHYQSSLIFLLIVSELYNNRTVSLSTGNSGIYNRLLDKMMVSLKDDWL